MVIRMLEELRERMNELNENSKTKIASHTQKKHRNHTQEPEMKNRISEKNTLE